MGAQAGTVRRAACSFIGSSLKGAPLPTRHKKRQAAGVLFLSSGRLPFF
jgi:hypothetical protein